MTALAGSLAWLAGFAPPDSAGAAPPDSTGGGDELPPWLRVPGDKLPTQNLLFGEEIELEVVDDELQKVRVVGYGRSKFYPNEAAGDLTEWNDVVGDTLHVWFTESQVDSVTVLELHSMSASPLETASKRVWIVTGTHWVASFTRFSTSIERTISLHRSIE